MGCESKTGVQGRIETMVTNGLGYDFQNLLDFLNRRNESGDIGVQHALHEMDKQIGSNGRYETVFFRDAINSGSYATTPRGVERVLGKVIREHFRPHLRG